MNIQPSNNTLEEQLIDLRSPDQFAISHIKDSINVPYGGNFTTWIGSIFGKDTKLSLIAVSQEQLDKAISDLHLIGFDQIKERWVWDDHLKSKNTLATLNTINVKEVNQQIQSKQSPYIVDVRSRNEWNSGHIAEAHLIELLLLTRSLDQIPKNKPILCICGGGFRASIAASWLKKQGIENVSNIQGGMQAWKQAFGEHDLAH